MPIKLLLANQTATASHLNIAFSSGGIQANDPYFFQTRWQTRWKAGRRVIQVFWNLSVSFAL